MGEPPIIPYAKLPEPMALPPRMTLPIPSAPLPSYQPLVLPSAEQIRQMRAAEQTSEQDQEQKPKESKPRPQPPIPIRLPAINTPDKSSQIPETTKVTLPGTDVKITVPKAEVLTTAAVSAGVAAMASVAATMAAGPVLQNLQRVLKPAMKTALKKLAAIRGVQSVNLSESDAKLRWRRHANTARRLKDGRV